MPRIGIFPLSFPPYISKIMTVQSPNEFSCSDYRNWGLGVEDPLGGDAPVYDAKNQDATTVDYTSTSRHV